MKHPIVKVVILCLIVILVGSNTGLTSAQTEWTSKVDPWLLTRAASTGPVEFLVYLEAQADLSGAAEFTSKTDKATYVYTTLRNLADSSQKPVIDALKAMGAEYLPYWVANMIWVRGDLGLIREMALRPDIGHIYANPQIQLEEPVEATSARQVSSPEENLIQVRAPDVWALGYTGQGVVIGGQDTGYDWEHPALKEQYRGWNGSSAVHDYNWHDAILDPGTGNTCGEENLQEPCDDNSHGTHTMGTMVGDDGGFNQIGMAPGARWIGCRNMDEGVGTPATYTDCYQWFIAPTRIDGSDPDPSKAPDVINNSWSCPPSEGCNPESLRAVVQAVHAAGIITVHSAGNAGSTCETVDTPAAIYPESFTVGATDNIDMIASFSSRGPVTVDNSDLLKPNVTAPGVDIRSSILGDGYGSKSGTSMAAPHVAGLMALLLSVQPDLAGYVDELHTLVQDTAVPRISSQDCGGIPGTQIPNNTYGWGRIDALAAVEGLAHSLQITKTPSAFSVYPGNLLTYTLSVAHSHLALPTNHLVMTDTLPGDLEFVSAAGGIYDPINHQVRWELSSLNPNGTWEEQLVVRVPGTYGSVTNDQYSVSSDEVAEVFGEPVTTAVHLLALDKNAPDSAFLSKTIPYTLTVTNIGPSTPATQLVLTDTLPDGSIFVSTTGSYDRVGDVIRWDRNSLDPGEEWVVHLLVEASEPGTLANQDYAVRSGQTTQIVQGRPVLTTILTGEAEISGEDSLVLHPGQTHEAGLILRNTGSLTDTFDLSIHSNLGWANMLSPNQVTLPLDGTAEIDYRISVPVDAVLPLLNLVEIQAFSQNADALAAEFTIQVSVEDRVFFLPLIPNNN